MITMTRSATFVTVSTQSFAWWLRRNRVPLPAPLNACPAARLEIDIDEIANWRDEDGDRSVHLANDENTRTQMKFPADWATAAQPTARALAATLAQPRWAVFATSTTLGDAVESFAFGLAGDESGFVVLDDGLQVRLAEVDPNDVSVTLSSQLMPPGVPAAQFAPLVISKTAVAAAAGRPDTTAAMLRAARVSADEIDVVRSIEQRAEVVGLLGATAMRQPTEAARTMGAQWIEAPVGGLIQQYDGEGGYTIDPLTPTNFTRALVHAVAAAT